MGGMIESLIDQLTSRQTQILFCELYWGRITVEEYRDIILAENKDELIKKLVE